MRASRTEAVEWSGRVAVFCRMEGTPITRMHGLGGRFLLVVVVCANVEGRRRWELAVFPSTTGSRDPAPESIDLDLAI